MSSQHLYVAQAVIPHAAMICASTRQSKEPPLRDERYVDKLSNLLCLTGCGFYDRLEEGGLVGPSMDTWSCAHERAAVILSNIAALEQKLKNYFSAI